MRAQELTNKADPNCLARQKWITKHMRAILIDWIVEIQHKWLQQAEALYLTVNLIDRFLSKVNVG
jgi:hypothetical protein